MSLGYERTGASTSDKRSATRVIRNEADLLAPVESFEAEDRADNKAGSEVLSPVPA